ncbi:hypothetical protein EXS54_00995 [Patescibacteria group bacterium]|nr:hypothetical protein [Patescibacteria group bacterium]
MNDYSTIQDGVRFIDAGELWRSVSGIPLEKRSRAIMERVGVEFFDKERTLIAKPAIAIIGLGGIPIRVSDNVPKLSLGGSITIPSLSKTSEEMMGIGGG